MSIGTRVLGGLLVNSLTAEVRAPSGSSNQCVGAGSGCLGGGQRGLGSSAGPTVSTLGGLMNLNSKKEGERGRGRTKVLSLRDLEACSQDQSKKKIRGLFFSFAVGSVFLFFSLFRERGEEKGSRRGRGGKRTSIPTYGPGLGSGGITRRT